MNFMSQDVDLAWHSDSPDLTPCFQKTVLVWIPCGYLWLFALLDLRSASTNPNAASPVPWSPLNLAKIGLAVTLAALDLAQLLLARAADVSYSADIYGPAVKIATFVSF